MCRRAIVLGVLVAATCIGCPTSAAGQSYLISLDPPRVNPADGECYNPRISADGQRVVFVSKARNLVPGDTSGKDHIYLWDYRGLSPVIVRLSVNNAGTPANGPSDNPSISPDGLRVAFNSTATNLGAPATHGWSNVYVRNIGGTSDTWTTTWASRASNGQVPSMHCGRPSMSNVGLVAFECLAGNMIPNDTNSATDVFVAGVDGAGIHRVSTTSFNNLEAKNGYSQYPSISADGRYVAFESYSNTLATGAASGDTNNAPDVFIKDRSNGGLVRILGLGGAEPKGSSLRPAISGDGRVVAFESQATNLVNAPTQAGFWHIYRVVVNDVSGAAIRRVSTDEYGGFRATLNYDGSKVAYEIADTIYLWDVDTTDPHLNLQASSASTGLSTNGPSRHAALAPSVRDADPSTPEDTDYLAWSSTASNLDGPTNSQWNIFVRGFSRTVEHVSPATAVAAPPSSDPAPAPTKMIFTNIEVRGRSVGEDQVLNVLAWNLLWSLAGRDPFEDDLSYERASGPPTVTVGGIAATGISTPDADTLRFTSPALPAGSSNIAVVRYSDGEAVKIPLPIRAMALVPNSPTDTDGDTLPDWWELTYGLDPNNASDGGAVQDNGLTPVESRAQQRNPTATANRYLAEGATNTLFHTRLALANPGTLPATALIRYAKTDGSLQTQTLTVPSMRRATVDVEAVSGMGAAEFATAVESDLPLVVDRTLRWGETDSYGAHAETAVPSPALTWYLAEGATTGSLNLFYLLQNPNAVEAQVRVRYLRPRGGPLEKIYALPPNSRTNIWVDFEEFPGLGQALASTDVSAVFDVLNAQPIIVERALYAEVPGQFFGAGHESAGITAPALEWFLAEGATGSYFDLFVLVANPGTADASIEATYLLPSGVTLVKTYTVNANSRFNIWVDYEDAQLANTAVSTTIRSTNGVPVIVERALWWPGTFGQWYEAHNSPGATSTGTRWALAEGEVGGTRGVETYILLANTSASPGRVRVTLLLEDRAPIEKTFDVAPRSRFNVDVGTEFPAARDLRFGALVESLGAAPAQIVVERAMYWNASTQPWAAGTNALATRLP